MVRANPFHQLPSIYHYRCSLNRSNASSFVVDDLQSADRVVLLGPGGRISVQGSYAQVAGSLPSTVVTKKATEGGSDSAATDVSPRSAPSQPRIGPTAKQPPTQSTPSSSAKDKARRTGDLKCYAAYGRSMGWMRALIFLLSAVAFAFTSKFSRKCFLGWRLLLCDYLVLMSTDGLLLTARC